MRETGTLEQATAGFGDLLLTSFATLVLLAFVVWLLVRFAGRWLGGAQPGRWLGRGSTGLIQVLDRVALDPRHTLHLVAVGDKTLLVATSESGVALLTEIDSRALANPLDAETQDKGPFHELLRAAWARVRARPDAPEAEPGPADELASQPSGQTADAPTPRPVEHSHQITDESVR